MQPIYTIFRREFRSYFFSLTAYVVLTAFIVGMGYFLFFFSGNIFEKGDAGMDDFFFMAPMALMIIIPLITMRSFAEENQNGTIELLYTRPINDWQILLGKYFSAMALVLIMLLPSLLYYYFINIIAKPAGQIDGVMIMQDTLDGFQWSKLDNGPIIGAYLGLIGIGSIFVGIGLLTSTLTDNVIVAFILSLTINVFLYIVLHSLADVDGLSFLSRIGIWDHYTSVWKGVIDSRDVIYLVSVNTILIIASKIVLTNRRK